MTSEMSQMTIFDALGESEDQYRLSLPDFLAKLFPLLGNVKDSLTEHEALSFLKSQGSHLFSDPSFYSLRTWMDSETTTEEERSESSSARWMRWGTWGGWQVLNSKDFGVPQNRERIFIVASLGSDCARKVFPITRENGGTFGKLQELTQGLADADRVYDPDGLARTLKAEGGGGGAKTGLYLIDDQGRTNNKLNPLDTAPTLRAQSHGNEPKVVIAGQYGVTEDETGTLQASRVDKVPMVVEEPRAVLTPDRLEKRQNGRRMKEPGEPMFTLTAQDLHGVAIQEGDCIQRSQSGVRNRGDQYGTLRAGASTTDFGVVQDYRIRKLTPLECFRLQSWPDEWYVKLKLFRHPELIELVDMTRNDITQQVLAIIEEHGIKEGISDSQLYKMAGNGVTSAVAYEIGLRLRELHESEDAK